ncbi:MAG: septal ring lytic transglycosylase RlpA family protein [Pseudomonadota bacterium]
MLIISNRLKRPLGLICACFFSQTAWADKTAADILTPAQISELISLPARSATADDSQLNWQQWGEAEASAQSVVDAPVPNWGLLPDALPEEYATLPALADDNVQAIANWQPFGVQGEIYRVKRLSVGRRQTGEASWYGPGFHGRKTASGEIFNMHALSAAHRTLPLPSYLRVTNTRNGMSVIVKVNDRGPYHGNRIIDLSYAAAKVLGIKGTGHVALEPVDGEEKIGKDRRGIALGSDPAYQVVLGNFADTHAAQLLQGRLMKRLPPGIPVKLSTTSAPIVRHRVEVGPLASPAEVQVLIRSIRAARMGFAEEPLRIRPGKDY